MKSIKRYKREKTILIVSFLAIPLFLLLLFTFYPIAVMLINSFTEWNGLSSPEQFVGFDNYLRIFTTEKYRMVFNNVIYYLAAGMIQQILALYFATLFSRQLRGGGFFKGVIFFPFIMNTVAVTFIFQMFFEINGGFDSILASIGMAETGLKWIADPKLVKFTLAFIYLWKNIGYSFVIYLGSMQSIPSDYYEAASIDGANSWQSFWAITFPGMKSIIGLLTTFAIVGSVAVFDIPYILTRGTNGTNTFTTTLIETAFQYNLYGVACAMAVLLMIFVAIVMAVKNIVFKEDE
ncbi:multiple sugar transport system permease protein [Hungatella effluvii]|uniref:Multiple sugar transport system permease protein n=1 Tax=Hungatella effluvii TaxID=1096246 RepID=A0A2V3YB62_9FIRM|nr:sugar ABC transporter permease [Hungatella effluvii]PXX48604.1 multiple sugar transport system permease protein [Hungatella effluvii]